MPGKRRPARRTSKPRLQKPERRLGELGIELPAPPPPGGLYTPVVRVGRLAFISGHVSRSADGTIASGVVGREIGNEAAAELARGATLGLLATLRREAEALSQLRRIVKVLGMVRAVENFGDHAKVMNGSSQVLMEIFGDDMGRPARSAVGMGSLPGGAALEIEMIVELR